MADLQPLRDWLAAHPSEDEAIAEMRGGDVIHKEGGTREITMPWMAYTQAIPDFWTALKKAGWDHPETLDYAGVVDRWRQAHGVERIRAEHLAGMDRHMLFNLLRWHDRGERFSTGTWTSGWQAGIFHAAARALIALG